MTQRARKSRRRSTGSVGKKIALGFGVLLAIVGIAIASVGLWALDVMASAPSIDTLKPIDHGEISEVFAADGTSLGVIKSDSIREPVDGEEIPKALRQATIAIEDENFYEHDGVDPLAVIRAAIENFEAREVKQGGSTITQQLVKNLYIPNPEDTLERKLEEAKLAMGLEEERSKPWILTEYLNTASYGTNGGRTAVGVEAASQVYFNKHVSDIDLDEAALLAGLPQAPSQYNPFTNPKRAIKRRNQVLRRMSVEGYINASELAQAKAEELGLERGLKYETIREPYFFDYVEQELIDEYGVNTVRQGGLKVHTTIDPELQAAAQEAIASHPTYGAANALVSTRTETGEIIAMASSAAYEDNQFNLAAQGARQPGSAFKPFVLTAAVGQGIDPDSTYYSAPGTISLDTGTETWTVSGGGSGSMSLRDATANSINTVYAQLALDVGAESFTEMAHDMGITSPLEPYPSYALGGTAECCSVLEMANAYATLANGGVHHKPTAISEVEFPDGEVEELEDPEGTRVISDGVAYEVVDVMTGTLDYGTAAGNDIACPAAGKTGTTEEQSDAWFVGFTPHVSTAVWTGNPDARVPLPGYGADLSAPIWQQFMTVAASEPCEDFPAPENPAELSGLSSENTSYSSYDSTYEDGTTYGAPAPAPTTPPATDSTDTGGYDPDLYAPGAGQEPAPAPDPAPAPPQGGAPQPGGDTGAPEGGAAP